MLNTNFHGFLILTCTVALILWFAADLRAQTEDADLNRAVAQFQQGQDAHEKGDLTLALKFYEQAVALNPEFPEAEYQRATILQQAGNRDAAEKSLRRAIELRADWSLPWAKLGALLAQKAVATTDSAQTASLSAEAVKVLNQAIALDPNNYPAFVALAELRLRTAAPPETLRPLLAAIKFITDGKANAGVQIWTARAALERGLNDFAGAKSSVSRALQIQPDNRAARLERAALALRQADFATATDDAKFVIGLEPNNSDAQILLAQIYFENNRASDANQILDRLPPEQKNASSVISLRNQILANSAGDAAGAATLEKALSADPKNVVLIGKLCGLNRTLNPAKALEYCRQANQLEPTNAAHAVGFGAALVQARRFDDAITVLNQILKVAPDNYTARANLAAALHASKRYPEAIAEFNRLIDRQPDIAASYFFLATAHDTLADYEAALAAYQKFLSLADSKQNQLEIDKVNLRLPILKRQIEKGAGKKKPKT